MEKGVIPYRWFFCASDDQDPNDCSSKKKEKRAGAHAHIPRARAQNSGKSKERDEARNVRIIYLLALLHPPTPPPTLLTYLSTIYPYIPLNSFFFSFSFSFSFPPCF